jgi:hypothetical protein
MRLQTEAGTSVVILDLTEPRHPKIVEFWLEVRSLDAGLTGQLRLELPCYMQVSSSPQTVANPAGILLAACSACCSVARADVVVFRGLLRQGA